MPITKQWPSGTVNATPTSYQLPLNNELNWLQLTSFLQSLADSAQGTTFQKMRVRNVTATPDTIDATIDCILAVNVASASVINLPAGLEKQIFFIVDSSGAAATNNITITPNGAETIRGSATMVLNKNYQGVILAFTGTDWKACGPFLTPGSVTDADFTGILTTAKGGTGQNSTATFPATGTVAVVPASGVVKSNGTVLSSSNVDLTSEVTGVLPNGNTTATSANTASAIVARDASGNFSAGTITGALNGNASTATSATTAGNVTGIVATANGGTGQNSTATFPTSGAVAVVPASGVVKSNGSVLSSSNVDLTSEVTGTLPNGNTTATSANTASAIVARDASGNFSAGTITASLSGNASTATSATTAGNVTGVVAIANGGSGQTTANAALNAFLPAQGSSANKYLKTDGTNTSWASASGGAGELNAILNSSGADGTTGWTNVSVVSGASSPLNPIVTTAFSISNTAISPSAESSTTGGYYPFTMPAGLLNKKLKVEFTFTTPATDDYRVSVWQGTNKVPLSTDSSGVTSLPASTTGKFTAYFDTDSNTSWTLSVTRFTGSTGACVITNVIVGPGIQPQGAVVGEWISFTPTIRGGSTSYNSEFATLEGRYRRVGDSIELNLAFLRNGTTATSSGAQIRIDLPLASTITVGAVPYNRSVGIAKRSSTTVVNGIAAITGTAYILIDDQLANTSLNYNETSLPINSTLQVEATVPIAEWAGSGTVNLAQNDVEFAFNTSGITAAGASDTTSFGYGPQGAANGAINFTTTNSATRLRCRFKTPIQSTDVLQLEFQFNGTGAWIPLSEFSGYIVSLAAQGTYVFGAGLEQVNETDVDVVFGNAGRTWGSTYAASFSSNNWLPTTRWRVRKSSAGAAVGFGIADTSSSGLVPSGTYNKSTGAWTLGPSTNSLTHTVNGNNINVQTSGTATASLNLRSTGGNSAVSFNDLSNGTPNRFNINYIQSSDTLRIANANGTTDVASTTQAGSWTFGNSFGAPSGIKYFDLRNGSNGLRFDVNSGGNQSDPHIFNINTGADNAGLIIRAGSTSSLRSEIQIYSNWNGISNSGGRVDFITNNTLVGRTDASGAWTLSPSTENAVNTNNGSFNLYGASGSFTISDPLMTVFKRATGGNNRIIAGNNGTTRGYIRINAGENNLEFEATSDRRVKTEIVPLDSSLDKIVSLNPVSFKMKHNLNVECEGFIAQEFNEIFPKAVSKTDNGEGEELPEGTAPWTMSDAILIPYLVKAVQELKAELDAAKAEIELLKSLP